MVKRENTDEQYVAKVIKDDDDENSYKREIYALNILNPFHNLYIINLISSGVGTVFWNNKEENEKRYIVLEHATKGTLFDYFFYPGMGFGELKSKVIFKKILEGIKCCHDHGICHRDIKLENVLLDDVYNPKICDFGFVTKYSPELEEDLGTEQYKAPEIWAEKPYDGFKIDIFSLGQTLMVLTYGIYGFKNATGRDKLYPTIALGKKTEYWNIIDTSIKGITQDFKDLFFAMVSFNPKKRPKIDEILNHNWFKEINTMKKEQKKILKKEKKLF